jgi:hypothetical protein
MLSGLNASQHHLKCAHTRTTFSLPVFYIFLLFFNASQHHLKCAHAPAMFSLPATKNLKKNKKHPECAHARATFPSLPQCSVYSVESVLC